MKSYTQNTLFLIFSLFLISCSDKKEKPVAEVKTYEELQKEFQIKSDEKEAYFLTCKANIKSAELDLTNNIDSLSDEEMDKALIAIERQKEKLVSEMDEWIKEMKILQQELEK